MFILTQPHLAPQKRRPKPNNKRLLSSIHTLLYNCVFVLILNTLNLQKISEDNLGQYTVKLPWNTAEANIYRQTFQIIRGRQKTIKQIKQLFLSIYTRLNKIKPKANNCFFPYILRLGLIQTKGKDTML